MSDPSGISTVNHNDDQDDSTVRNSSTKNTGHGNFPFHNSRITSPHILKMEQNHETKLANNRAYDEVHEVESKHSHVKKTMNDEQPTPSSSNHQISHDLMQSNYYDQARFDANHSPPSTKLSSERTLDINVEDYKKKIATVSNNKKHNSQSQAHSSPPFGITPESIQEGIAQSASGLLEVNKNPNEQDNLNERSLRKSKTTHERAALDYFPNNEESEDEDRTTRQRSESKSSESSTSSSSTSTTDPQSSNKFDSTTIPYQKLCEEDDDNETLPVQPEPKTNINESTNLLSKNQSTTYGTQTNNKLATSDRARYLQNNGYNSQGSSVTTKSSSDNSGSVRTNSGSDNDEESDEEHYINSALANNSKATSNFPSVRDSSTKLSHTETSHARSTDNSTYSKEKLMYRSSGTRTEQRTTSHDEQHLQLPRFKQSSADDSNETNIRKDNGSFDSTSLSKWSSQISGTNSASSSQQTRNLIDRPDQSSNSNSNRRTTMRPQKKRKQLQQQDLIRTESIPGHRGNLDVDELIMFIDGDSSKTSSNTNNSNHNETKTNSVNESNSNKIGSKKKSRKTSKTTQLKTTSSAEQDENNQATNETVTEVKIDTTDKMEELQTTPSDNKKTEISLSTRATWFEQVSQASFEQENEENDQSTSTVNKDSIPSNSTIASDSFVTVTRRRPIKERRQDSNPSFTASSSKFSATPSTINHEKRRYTSMSQQENTRSSPRNSLAQIKMNATSSTKEDVTNANNQAELVNEKVQSSSHLSSHSSTSSLPSLTKRQSKPPPVVFLNKSINVELDDVSFGFDFDAITVNKSTDISLSNESTRPVEDKDNRQMDNTSITPVSAPSVTPQQMTSNENLIDSATENIHERSTSVRTTRDPQFYSGPDIRPHHRPYPAATVPTGPNYIDPRLLMSYNPTRYPNYPSHLGYMNYIRTPYISPQTQYLILPSSNFATKSDADAEEKSADDSSNPTNTETVAEPLVVYTTVPNPTGALYYHHPSVTATAKAPIVNDLKQNPVVYPTTSTVYPNPIFYPGIPQQPVPGNMFPSPTAYFQPIASPSLFIETKTDQQESDQTNYEYSNPNKSYATHEQLPSTSSDIMSSALQLVYSRQKQNAQTDRFNLDELTSYLTMKWKEAVNHYDQGDSRTLVVDRRD